LSFYSTIKKFQKRWRKVSPLLPCATEKEIKELKKEAENALNSSCFDLSDVKDNGSN